MSLLPQLTAIHFLRGVLGGRNRYIEHLKKVNAKKMCIVKPQRCEHFGTNAKHLISHWALLTLEKSGGGGALVFRGYIHSLSTFKNTPKALISGQKSTLIFKKR